MHIKERPRVKEEEGEIEVEQENEPQLTGLHGKYNIGIILKSRPHSI